MSNALGIAGVTAVLVDLLNNGLIDHDLSSVVGSTVTVGALPPDRVLVTGTGGEVQDVRLNLYLYLVTPNIGWRNMDLPSKDLTGKRLTNPPLALDLHYMLTAYAQENFQAEILLGYAMQLLHETPVLSRQDISTSLAAPPSVDGTILPTAMKSLSAADLADQVELIKITPKNLSTEEMFKLWTAMQSNYRPSSAYQASVVLIQSKYSTKPVLPVNGRNLYIMPFQQPKIEKVLSQSAAGQPIIENQPILAGYKLFVDGEELKREITRVLIDQNEIVPEAGDIGNTRVGAALPANLQAGLHQVQVVSKRMMGTPPTEHRGFESNAMPFVLQPSIGVAIANITGAGTQPRSADITVTFTPDVSKDQRVTLLLNQMTDTDAQAYSFIADKQTADTNTITFAVSNVQAGDYLVRVQVDGAESPLDVKPDPTDPEYISPKVSIP